MKLFRIETVTASHAYFGVNLPGVILRNRL